MNHWQPIGTVPLKPFDPVRWYMPHSENILVWTGSSTVIASYHYTQKGKGKWHANGRVIYGLTHWMPLPEPPK